MYKILKLNNINEKAEKNLSKGYIVSDNEANPDGIIVRSFKMNDYKVGDNLIAVARAGAGVNNIPVDAMKSKGFVVFNTPGANANAVKELVLAGMLLSSRDIIKGSIWASGLKDKGAEVPALVEKGKAAFGGTEIMGKTIGIIGLGAIGSMVAQASIALKMDVIGYDPFLTVDTAWTLSSDIRRAKNINTIYQNSDYITIHSPLTDDTKGMLNNEAFSKMKDGVKIINCARGELVNNADMIEALKSGKVSRYVTDFPSEDLIGIDNVIIIPHLGASTEEAEINCAIMAADELKEYLENGNIINSVNYPNISQPRVGAARITFNLLSGSPALSEAIEILKKSSLEIVGTVSGTRADSAYMIIDLNTKPADNVIAELKNISGVLKLRVI